MSHLRESATDVNTDVPGIVLLGLISSIPPILPQAETPQNQPVGTRGT